MWDSGCSLLLSRSRSSSSATGGSPRTHPAQAQCRAVRARPGPLRAAGGRDAAARSESERDCRIARIGAVPSVGLLRVSNPTLICVWLRRALLTRWAHRKAPGCGPGGRGFESRRSPTAKPLLTGVSCFRAGRPRATAGTNRAPICRPPDPESPSTSSSRPWRTAAPGRCRRAAPACPPPRRGGRERVPASGRPGRRRPRSPRPGSPARRRG